MFHLIYLCPSLIKKFKKNYLSSVTNKVKRCNEPEANQKIQFLKSQTFVYNHQNIKFHICSVYNALNLNKKQNTSLFINCCASEFDIHGCIKIYGSDDDDSLNLNVTKINRIIALLNEFKTQQHKTFNIYINCWMGCSRSVGFCILLLLLLDENIISKAKVQHHFNFYYKLLRIKRPCIAITEALKKKVIEYVQINKLKEV